MLTSILYNLISNAIKYRSLDRPLEITITAQEDGDYIRIDVVDNGIGLDVERYKEKLFGLYKRFHTHTEGKGIGLFLVKLQTEVLGGKVDVKSTPGKGTTFSIYIKSTFHHADQVLVDNEIHKLYFDAPSNSMVTIWKRDIVESEFTLAGTQVLEIIRSYNASNWISDITSRAAMKEKGMEGLRLKFLQELLRLGIKRMAIVCTNQQELADYTSAALPDAGVDFLFFETVSEASDWLKKHPSR
jgi:anti-sigma regulatory factor (Ser/Thr protein kinase)